jgi:uncharacterized protein (DUF983 family)
MSAQTGPQLPRNDRARALLTVRRALLRRCPYCGSSGIFRGYLALREVCPTCGARFEREEGYFLGAYALNLVVAEIIGLTLAILLLFRTDLRHLDLIWQEIIAIAIVVALPILFFPYSRAVWIAIDLTFHPPRGPERQLRGVQASGDVDRPSGS